MKHQLFSTLASVFILAMLTTTQADAKPIPEIDCLIEPNTVVNLSSPVSGVLDTISVDRSDAVKKNAIVATLKSDIEQLNVKTSTENLKLSKKEHRRAVELYREKAITLSEKEKADHEKALYELELKNSLATLELRRIRSPIEGVVVDRYKMPGEYVEDKPILKIAQLDPLRVEVVSSVENFGLIKKGMHAQIIPEYGDFENLIAEIVLVDQVIDAASGTFGIRLELNNKDNKVPGGLKCKVRFFSEDEDNAYTNKPPLRKKSLDTAVVNTAKLKQAISKQPVSNPATPKQVESRPPVIQLSVKPSEKEKVKPPVLNKNGQITLAPAKTVATTNTGITNTDAVIKSSVIETSSKTTAEVCSSIGVFKDRTELSSMINGLGEDIVASDIREQVVENKTYLVNTVMLQTLEEARRYIAEIRQWGISDTAIIPRDDKFVIALGLYSSRNTAEKQLLKLEELGIVSTITPRSNKKTVFWGDMVSMRSGQALLTQLASGNKKLGKTLVSKPCDREELGL